MENESTNPGQYNGRGFMSKRVLIVSVLVLVLGFMAADLAYVNISLSDAHTSSPAIAAQQPVVTSSVTPTPLEQSQTVQIPSQTISSAPTPPPLTLSPTSTPTPIPFTPTPIALVKEYFIPLGTGQSQAGSWEDIPGAQVSADFGQYPHIKQILFEASVTIPSGSEWVSVRLFNETDMHPVWNSTVTSSGNVTSAALSSSPIIYDIGRKIYQVQLQTQLQAPANLVESRIHIMLQ